MGGNLHSYPRLMEDEARPSRLKPIALAVGVLVLGVGLYVGLRALDNRGSGLDARTEAAVTELFAAKPPATLRPLKDCYSGGRCLVSREAKESATPRVEAWLKDLGYDVGPPACDLGAGALRGCRMSGIREGVSVVATVLPRPEAKVTTTKVWIKAFSSEQPAP